MAGKKGQHVLSSGELGVISLGQMNHLVGATATLLTNPSGANGGTLILDVESGNFRAKLGDYTAAAANLISNGDFTSTSWPDRAWKAEDAAITFDGSVAAFDGTQLVAITLGQDFVGDEIPLAGENYVVDFDVLNYVSGSITVYINGGAGTARSANGSYNETIAAGSNADFDVEFIASDDFVGEIDNVSVTHETLAYAVPLASVTDGTGTFKLRQDRPISISNPSELTVVGDGAGAILTYYWI